jgi:bacillithiol system protein YtxJ
MHPNLIPVRDLTHLDELIEASHTQPVVLFKHSFSCGVSAEALDELVSHLHGDAGAVRYGLITVQTHRDVSNAAAGRLGVRHQSPQAILLHSGRVVWSASHFRVNSEELRRAIDSVLLPAADAPAP